MKRVTLITALMLTTLTIASCGSKQTAAEPANEAATSAAETGAEETSNEAETFDTAATQVLADGVYYSGNAGTCGRRVFGGFHNGWKYVPR